MNLQFKEDFWNILIGLVLQTEERINNGADPLTYESKSWVIRENDVKIIANEYLSNQKKRLYLKYIILFDEARHFS